MDPFSITKKSQVNALTNTKRDSFRAFPKSDTESPFPKRALLSCKNYNQMVQVQAVLDLMTIQPQSSVAK